MRDYRALSFSEIWSSTMSTVGRRWILLVGVALLLGGVDLVNEVSFTPLVATIITLMTGAIGNFLLLAILLKSEGLSEDFPGWARLAPYLGVFLLSGVLISLGILFLIVPGLILLARWSIAYPFALNENLGVTEAMQESWDATAKSQGAITSFYAVVVFVLIVAMGLASVALGVDSLELTTGSDPILLAKSYVSYVISEAGGTIVTASGVAIFALFAPRLAEFERIFE